MRHYIAIKGDRHLGNVNCMAEGLLHKKVGQMGGRFEPVWSQGGFEVMTLRY